MEMLLRFGQRGIFPAIAVTYPIQRIYWCQKQHHRLSSTKFLVTMGYATGGWISAGTQEQSYPWSFQATPMLSLTAYKYLNYLSPRHLSRSLSYLIRIIPWWRGGGCLPMEISWCGLVCGSLWKPFNVFSAIFFGATAQFIPLRHIECSQLSWG